MSSDPITRRLRGRPPVEDGVSTRQWTLTITHSHYEALAALAGIDRSSPQAVARRAIAYYLGLRQRALAPPTPAPSGAPRFPRSVTRRGF